MGWPRRHFMRSASLLLPLASVARPASAAPAPAPAPTPAPALLPRQLQFPRDFGSHPELRTEWWYLTGSAQDGARSFGFQVTFFRSRVDATQSLQSALAAKQLIFAHAAVTDVRLRRQWHDQRIARAMDGSAQASSSDTDLRLRDWSLKRDAEGYRAQIAANAFALDLLCTPTQPPLLQGDAGLSRKGPDPTQASYYYSQPQLATSGQLTLQGQRFQVRGTAWLDHEWSEALLHPNAVGWDWCGMNLADGSALTAFQLRDQAGAALWSGGSWRDASGALRIFGPNELVFTPLRYWRSPASQARYPVAWTLQTPVGRFSVHALLDAQELDSRSSTGAIYWEGLSELRDARGQVQGRGYLELTGYAGALRM